MLDLQGISEAKVEHKEFYFSSPKYNIANQMQSRDALLLKFIDVSYLIKSNAIIIQRFIIQFTAFFKDPFSFKLEGFEEESQKINNLRKTKVLQWVADKQKRMLKQ